MNTRLTLVLSALALGAAFHNRPQDPAPRRLVSLSMTFVEVPSDSSATCRARKTTDPSDVLRLGKVQKVPKITVFDGQLSHTMSLESFPYIRRIDVSCPADGSPAVFEPVVAVGHVGFAAECRPVITADGVRLASLTFRAWERAPE